MNQRISIRKTRNVDAEEIYKLGKKISELAVSDRMQYYERDEVENFVKNSKGNIFLVALDNNIIIGSVYAKIISRHWCMCDSIMVHPKYRRKMIGNMLMERLFSILKKKRINYVQGVSNLENKRARKFLKSIGFCEGKKMVWMEKFL